MGFAYFYSIGRQTWHEFRYWGHKGFDRILQTPLPRIFLLCLAIALICIVLPLTITLFLVFVLLKIVFSMLFFAVRRSRKQPQLRQHFK